MFQFLGFLALMFGAVIGFKLLVALFVIGSAAL